MFYGTGYKIKKGECISDVRKRLSRAILNVSRNWMVQRVKETLEGKGDEMFKNQLQ